MWNTNELWWQLSPKLPIFFPLSCPYLVLYFPQSWFNPSIFVFSEASTTLEHPLKDFVPKCFSIARTLLSLLFFPQVCILESLSLTSESEFRSLLNSLLGLNIARYSSISRKCFKCHSILLHLQGRFLLHVTLTWGHFLSS